MAIKLGMQIIISEFDSHWVPNTSGLIPTKLSLVNDYEACLE